MRHEWCEESSFDPHPKWSWRLMSFSTVTIPLLVTPRATSSSSSFYFSFFSSSSSSYNDIDTYIYQLFTRLASFAGVVVVVVPAWNSQGWMDRKVLIVLGIGRCNVFWTFRETMLARDNRVANARSGKGEGSLLFKHPRLESIYREGKKKGKGRKRDTTARVDRWKK